MDRAAISTQRVAAWHVLQYSDALDLELASALALEIPTTLWQPVWRSIVALPGTVPAAALLAPGLQLRRFPAQRGLSRLPAPLLLRTGGPLRRRLLAATADPQHTALLCTNPFSAPVAMRWPGPVVYWLSDYIARYRGMRYRQVRALDQALCSRATLVCPNSQRLADYLHEEAGCPPSKLEVLPNAVNAQNVLSAPLLHPTALPELATVPRPVAGVCGNLGENMDWLFLLQVLASTPWLHWLFVGPTGDQIHDRAQRDARSAVMAHPRTHFIGSRPYAELSMYARALDVAVLPYRRREPTYSGCSTRFFEHLAACHPILATPHVADLLHRTPLVRLVGTPEEAANALQELRLQAFDDGLRQQRWEASQHSTWQTRAEAILTGLGERLALETGTAGA